MRIAFVAALSDKKLAQKLAPLQALEEVTRIGLFRRRPFAGDKIRWSRVPGLIGRSRVLGDLWRFAALLLSAWRYDLLVACHQELHGVMARIAGRIWRRPVVQMVISGPLSIYERPLLRWAMMGARACAVRGEVSAAQLRGLGYAGAVEIVANPFEPPAEAGRDGLPPDTDLLAVGNWSREKGYPWLLEVLALVKRSRPGVRLAIAGEGPWERHLGRALDRLGLRDNVLFPGWLDEAALARAYRGTRALVLASYTEGLPMVVLEAMAHGVPVFATRVGELSAFIRDGVDGRLFGFGETQALAGALALALADPPGLAALGERGRARLREALPAWDGEAIRAAWRRLLAVARAR